MDAPTTSRSLQYVLLLSVCLLSLTALRGHASAQPAQFDKQSPEGQVAKGPGDKKDDDGRSPWKEATNFVQHMTETKIKGSRKIEIQPLQQADGITAGLVIAYGHLIAPPYKIEYQEKGLLVNGVQVQPSLIMEREAAASAPFSVEQRAKFARVAELMKTLKDEYRVGMRSKSLGEVQAGIIDRIKKSTDVFENPEWLGKDVLIVRLAFAEGSRVLRFSEKPPEVLSDDERRRLAKEGARKFKESDLSSLKKMLGAGAWMAFSSTGDRSMGPGDCRAKVNQIMAETGLTDEQRIEKLRERVFFNVKLARDVVENYQAAEWRMKLAMTGPATTASGALSVGRRGILNIPVTNLGAKNRSLQNVRISVTGVPSWFRFISRQSQLGPQTIPPGETFQFQVAFLVQAGFSPSAWAELDYQVTMDNADVDPAGMTCQLRTTDGFETMGKICQDSSGTEVYRTLLPDTTAPVATITLVRSPFVDSAGKVFISTDSPINLDAIDPTDPFAKSSGVTLTGFLVDPAGNVNSVDQLTPYHRPFFISEGGHTIVFASQDAAGNQEVIQSTTVFADATPPVTRADFSGSFSSDSRGNLSFAPSTLISLSGADPVSAGGSSGMSRILVSTDNLPTFLYTGPFSLSQGYHPLSFVGIDNAENAEKDHVLNLFVGVAIDTEPPVTQPLIVGTSTVIAGNLTALFGSSISFSATDLPADIPASGVDKTFYLFGTPPENCPGGTPASYPDFNSGFGTCKNAVFWTPVSLPPGNQALYYYSVDRAGNKEPTKSIKVVLRRPQREP